MGTSLIPEFMPSLLITLADVSR